MATSNRPKIFIIFYSLYGHVYTMAQAVKEGVEKVADVDVQLFQLKETLDDSILEKMQAPPRPNVPIISPAEMVEADAFLLGVPTRYGNMPEQWKCFWDATGQLWVSGALNNKMAGVFYSTASQHGGQETTAMTMLTTLAHHGMIYVPLGYRSSHLFTLNKVMGSSPYGAGTITNGDGSRMPSEEELEIASAQGQLFARTVSQFVRGGQNLSL
ncbi:hypothetical protein H4R34_002589 [Dimargaris verticillata]|uniref:Flavodoxin-like domain-containing protein n=1 Tax=Dimargaris verticillata TaxID=2761393 RepID=A0A9W8B7U4_9FUNG|nr:hypothetical protein H4R34_002589 [Dimargaris verticillata]